MSVASQAVKWLRTYVYGKLRNFKKILVILDGIDGEYLAGNSRDKF